MKLKNLTNNVYLGAMKLRTIVIVIIVAILLLATFYLGRRSAQYTYNKMTNRFELASRYASRQHDIVMLGNSIMAHGDWQRATGRCDIMNLGIGGLTIADLPHQLDKVYGCRPKYCFIEVGINDIVRGADYPEYIAQLGELVSDIQGKGIKVVSFHILYTAATYPGYEQISEQVTRYNRGIDSLAAALNSDVLNMNDILAPGKALLPEYAQPDGLHVNEAGYAIWGDELNKYLQQHK